MKKILLTGGSGFIGRNIQEQLGKDYEIFAPSSGELDLLDNEAVGQYLQRNRITDVIHGAVYNQKRREINADLDLSSNLKMFYHLVEYAPHLDKLIYFGSGAEFDKRFPIVMAKEEDFGKRIPLLNDYGLGKYLMNLEARKSQNIYNLRLFGVYGPHENRQTCFPSHLCNCVLTGQPLTIRQDCRFDFLYIDDLMEPLQWCLEHEPQYHDYNICSGQPVYLSEMAKMMCTIVDRPLDIQCLTEGLNLEYTGSNERIMKECQCSYTSVERGSMNLFRFLEKI